MKTLISKLQYYYYETGEFSEVEERSLEDTLSFIYNFPWEQQRNEIFINLNGPSVTIENDTGVFLKLGIDYNRKFILYYLNEKNRIFCRVGKQITEFEEIIRSFFGTGIDESTLHKYRDWLFHKEKHFVTGKFEYGISLGRVFSVTFLPVISTLIFLPIALFGPGERKGMLFVAMMVIPFYLPHCRLFWNYYFHCKDLHFKIAQGTDEFYFGKKGQVKKYNKKDIKTITAFNNHRHKNLWAEFYVFRIEIAGGEVLTLTNFIIGDSRFSSKFPDHNIINKHVFFPLVKKDKFKIS